MKQLSLLGLLAIAQLSSAQSPPRTAVTCLGRIEPISRVLDIAGRTGERVTRVLVTEGQSVKANDVIAELDGYSQAVTATARASARLNEARDAARLALQEARVAVEAATLKLAQLNTLFPLDKQTHEATLRRMQAELDLAESNRKRLETLRANSGSTNKEYDDIRHQHAQAVEQLATGKLALERLIAAHELNLKLAQAELDTATLKQSRAKLDAELIGPTHDVKVAEADVERYLIRAPCDGVVFRLLTHAGERINDKPICKFGDTSSMFVVAEVYETDAGLVRKGQPVEITSPALPKPLSGAVVEPGVIVFKNDVLDTDPAAKVDARVIETRIKLDDPAVAARFNHLQVRVRIDTAEPAAAHSPTSP